MGKIVRFTLLGALALVILLAAGLWIAGGGDGRWKYTTFYSDGVSIGNLPDSFTGWGAGRLGPVPVPVLVAAVVVAMVYLLLRRTVFGRRLYAVGASEEAARLSGVNVRWIKLGVYVLMGMLAAVAGLLLASRLGAGDPKAGQMYELTAIAAVVVGGTSLTGGRGGIGGTVLGALIIGVLDNGLVLMDVSAFYQMVVKGLVILGAVALDRTREAR